MDSSGDTTALSAVRRLVEAATGGNSRAIARLISLVEEDSPLLRDVIRELKPSTGSTYVVGLTGAPGVGKSTSTSALVGAYRARGAKVGVLAIDPSSPFSGGALLGDRIRMAEHTDDPGVYIRSMAARGHLGGLSRAAPQALRVLEAAGCDVVLLETVGVGQSEVDIAGQVDTTLVLVAPGMGDGIQAAKAGILEIGDIYVVNKADREGADQTARDLRQMLTLARKGPPDAWEPPVLCTVASRAEGIDDVLDAVEAHRAHTAESGELAARRARRVAAEIEQLALSRLRARLAEVAQVDVELLVSEVTTGRLDPYAAADRLVATVLSTVHSELTLAHESQ